MNSKPSTSPEALNPTTRNLLGLLKDTPVITIKRDISGRYGAEDVFKELRALSGDGFRVFEDGDSMSIIRDGASRNFLV